jgi:hypothetical protein
MVYARMISVMTSRKYSFGSLMASGCAMGFFPEDGMAASGLGCVKTIRAVKIDSSRTPLPHERFA